MWSEQIAQQDTTPAPILEGTILGAGEEHVIVKLLTTNNAVSSSGSEVLTKLLTGSSGPAAVNIGGTTGVLMSSVHAQGLRKIEPKPAESGNESEKLVEADCEANASGRLLDINATRRGVKTCPLCTNKIGYRAKQCKYCSPGKQKRRSRKSRQSKESRNDSEQDSSNVSMEMVLIDSETEVSTSEIGNAAEVSSTAEVIPKKIAEVSEPIITESFEQGTQPTINTIESTEAETSQQNNDVAAEKRSHHTSLQELIHTLLVQNQNSLYITQDSEVQDDKVGTGNPDSNQHEEVGGEEIKEDQRNSLVAAGPVGSPENAYDANSVALFLGHLAQQNGKKIRTALNPVSDNAQSNTSVSSLIGVKTKHVVIEDDMSSQAKYRKIRPKSIDEGTAVVEIQSSVGATVEEDIGDSVGEVKPTESQLRMLPGNATRRGVMPCQKCQCLIGCRSKVCKHCKFLLNEANPPFRRNRKLLRQAIQLQIPSNSVVTVFSVRRSKVGPDHRCFVWCESNDPDNRMKDMYSCDYPPCVTERELGNKPTSFLCEHAKICRAQGSTMDSRVLELNQEKLFSEYLTAEVSNSLNELNSQCSIKGVPLVQGVSDRTFVVVDQLHTDERRSLTSDLIGFVHVRFERSKVGSLWQTQVFCSGRACMAWNPVFSCVSSKGCSQPTVLRSLNCIHYSACLWAITSNENLEHEFKLYLEGAKVKVKGSVMAPE